MAFIFIIINIFFNNLETCKSLPYPSYQIVNPGPGFWQHKKYMKWCWNQTSDQVETEWTKMDGLQFRMTSPNCETISANLSNIKQHEGAQGEYCEMIARQGSKSEDATIFGLTMFANVSLQVTIALFPHVFLPNVST